MMQMATDADIIAHADDLIARRRPEATEGTDTGSLIAEIEILVDALRRHQPVPPSKGWNDAWDRFDGRPAAQ
jgi:hypothetical protein